MKLLCSYLLLLGFFCFNCSIAQNSSVRFKRLSLEQGLSQSSAFSICQDQDGFIWIGTYDGLNRFDGYDIEIYRKDDSLNLFQDNYINKVYLDKQNRLWIGTNGKGLYQYDFIHNSFLEQKLGDETDLQIRNINEDNDGRLFISTNKGLFKLVDEVVEEVDFGLNEVIPNVVFTKGLGSGISGTTTGAYELWPALGRFGAEGQYYRRIENIDSEIKSIVRFQDKFILGGDNLYSYDAEGKEMELEIPFKDGKKAPVTSLLIDYLDVLWVGTENGLFSYDGQNWASHYHNPTQPYSLSSNVITSIFEDEGHVLWIGTSLGGVCYWDRSNSGMNLLTKDPGNGFSLSSSKIRSMYQDNDGDYWIGTVEGGLNRWNRENNTLISHQTDPNNSKSISHNHVRKIFEDSRGTTWVLTDGGGVNLFDKKTGIFSINPIISDSSKNLDRVWDMCESPDGRIWFAFYGDGLGVYNPNENSFKLYNHSEQNQGSINNDFVTRVYCTEDKLYVGTFGGGLNVYDENSDSFEHYTHNPADNKSISDDRVYSILSDSKNQIWIGTKKGLNKFTDGKFKSYTTSDGLPNNVIMGLLEDENRNLWLSTNFGLSRFNIEDDTFRNYNKQDGLQDYEFLVCSFYKSREGELFFGGISGLNYFFPENIKENTFAPKPLISSILINNEPYQSDTATHRIKHLSLQYYENEFTIEFMGLNFISQEKNTYEYKLSGFDKDWVNVGTRRFAKYTNVPPGKYTFEVRAYNSDGVLSETNAILSIRIHPAFWQTIWFKSLLIAILIILLIAIYKVRMRAIQRVNEKLEKQVKERTAEVVAQKEEIEVQKQIVDLRNEEVTASITYARRLQKALLPTLEQIKTALPDSFVMFKPKDIVSGDFYWMETNENPDNKLVFFSAADCTGHGVPGALVSVVCSNALHKAVSELNLVKPGEILDSAKQYVEKTFEKSGENIKDGMDISFCALNKDANKLMWAGAFNPLWIIRKNESLDNTHQMINNYKEDITPVIVEDESHHLIEFRANRQPIGKFENYKAFNNHEIQLEQNDVIYLFSDGYADQFGGDSGKKMKSKIFKKLLLSIQNLSMDEQLLHIEKTFNDWKSDYEQIDDVVVFGVKI